MARNAIKSDFRSSKMGAHFVKNFFKKKLRIDLARNAIESDFWSSKMAVAGYFVQNVKEKNMMKKLVRSIT